MHPLYSADSSSHSRLGSNLLSEFVVIAFVTDVLVAEHFTIHFNFISKIIGLVVDSWVVCILLGSKVRCKNPETVSLSPDDAGSPVCHVVKSLHRYVSLLDGLQERLSVYTVSLYTLAYCRL